MTFFESIPQPPPPEPVRHRSLPWMRPETVIPGSVPAEAVLCRTEQVAVAVGSVRAYPNGFEFTVHVRLHPEAEATLPDHIDVFQRPRPGAAGDDSQLRLGILYADGRRAASTRECWPSPDDADDERLVLHQDGGGGSSHSCDWDFWVHPLPPAGPVVLVASWLEHGIGESRTELDGAAIRAAAGRAVTLWPEEPEPERDGSWRSQTFTFAHSPGETEPGQPAS